MKTEKIPSFILVGNELKQIVTIVEVSSDFYKLPLKEQGELLTDAVRGSEYKFKKQNGL